MYPYPYSTMGAKSRLVSRNKTSSVLIPPGPERPHGLAEGYLGAKLAALVIQQQEAAGPARAHHQQPIGAVDHLAEGHLANLLHA